MELCPKLINPDDIKSSFDFGNCETQHFAAGEVRKQARKQRTIKCTTTHSSLLSPLLFSFTHFLKHLVEDTCPTIHPF